jgi:hypothetical protein
MKRIHYLNYFLLMLIFIFSCKKKTIDLNTVNNSTNNTNYNKLKYMVLGDKMDTVFFYYNSDNRLKEFVKPSDTTFNTIWVYESDGYFIKRKYSNPENNFLFHCKLNPSNIVKTIFTSNDTINYNYLNGLLISSTSSKNKGLYSVYWDGGNISKYIKVNKYGVDTLNYEYFDVKNNDFWKVIGFSINDYFTSESFIGFPSGCEIQNLVKNIKNNKGQIIKEFVYEYDKNGYVSKLTSISYGYNNLGIQSSKYTNVFYFGWY